MSKFLPPQLRNNPKPEELKIDEKSFPDLAVQKAPVKTYADQAENWRIQKTESELKERVDAQMEMYRQEKKTRQKEEDALLIQQNPFRNRVKKTTVEVQKVEAPKEDDGWTLVEKKPRHIRKDKVNFDEVPEEMSSSSSEEDDCQDKDSLWN